MVATFRRKNGDCPKPSRAAIDSQSIKSVPFVSQDKGVDSSKLINGRKRHIAVDKHGLPIALAITAADVHDSKAGAELLWQMEGNERLELFCLDKAYRGEFLDALNLYGWRGEIAKKPDSTTTDGNIRTARITSNAILIANQHCPLFFRTVDSIDYKKAMLVFYEQNNITAFRRIFIDQFEFAVKTYF
ncbi:transposase [Tunicatimonas pelagia]|uniref:transposase n=1 Tax=Tunicatimonas pelagia TaxID=931531 RepID=UPI0026651BBC|nr:transposase [Tunicatimonas pelagia]WKN46388.1 transposase [Tunicatimonas pelagia]